MAPNLRAFAYGYLANALVSARDDAEKVAGWSYPPDHNTTLFVVAKRAGGLVASGALDEAVAIIELFACAHRTGLLAAIGVGEASGIIANGLIAGTNTPADWWGYLPDV
jgi:hypothetical protein